MRDAVPKEPLWLPSQGEEPPLERLAHLGLWELPVPQEPSVPQVPPAQEDAEQRLSVQEEHRSLRARAEHRPLWVPEAWGVPLKGGASAQAAASLAWCSTWARAEAVARREVESEPSPF